MIKVRVPKEERTSDNKLYQRLKKVHYGMMDRCYYGRCANLKNTHTRGWQFRFKEDLAEHPFLPREELIIVGKRNRRVLATFPDGKTEVITNRSKFSRDHSLNRKSMYEVLSGKRTEHRGCKFEFIDK